MNCRHTLTVLITLMLVFGTGAAQAATKIVHDAEYYILEAQHGKQWAKDDKAVDAKLARFRKKNGFSCLASFPRCSSAWRWKRSFISSYFFWFQRSPGFMCTSRTFSPRLPSTTVAMWEASGRNQLSLVKRSS